MPSLKNIFDKFNDLNILVIGDVMIDSYLWGKVNRISPEAPVPIVNVVKREKRLGGAANVALNLMALGAKPHLIALIGDDPEGNDILELLREQKFSTEGLVKSSERPTTIKHRVIGGSQQLLRVDAEDNKTASSREREELKKKIISKIDNCNAVVFEDYDKGVIDEELISFTVGMCKSKGIPVSVDPKKRNFLHYKNVDIFKPNLKETIEGLNISIDPSNLKSLNKASENLKSNLNHKMTLLTLSEFGVYYDSNKADLIPAHRREISDVSGAGDTVISIATCCMALDLEAGFIAELSNLGGGLVCEHIGVVPIIKELLLKEAENSIDLKTYGLVG
jgi:rfaE bifunctional protein kinase chain/domain